MNPYPDHWALTFRGIDNTGVHWDLRAQQRMNCSWVPQFNITSSLINAVEALKEFSFYSKDSPSPNSHFPCAYGLFDDPLCDIGPSFPFFEPLNNPLRESFYSLVQDHPPVSSGTSNITLNITKHLYNTKDSRATHLPHKYRDNTLEASKPASGSCNLNSLPTNFLGRNDLTCWKQCAGCAKDWRRGRVIQPTRLRYRPHDTLQSAFVQCPRAAWQSIRLEEPLTMLLRDHTFRKMRHLSKDMVKEGLGKPRRRQCRRLAWKSRDGKIALQEADGFAPGLLSSTLLLTQYVACSLKHRRRHRRKRSVQHTKI